MISGSLPCGGGSDTPGPSAKKDWSGDREGYPNPNGIPCSAGGVSKPNGIPSPSPGLRRAARYPGFSSIKRSTPTWLRPSRRDSGHNPGGVGGRELSQGSPPMRRATNPGLCDGAPLGHGGARRAPGRRVGILGQIEEGTFTCVLVEGTRVLEMVSASIDLNPLRAGLVGDPVDYQWCEYAAAVSGDKAARKGIARAVFGPRRCGGRGRVGSGRGGRAGRGSRGEMSSIAAWKRPAIRRLPTGHPFLRTMGGAGFTLPGSRSGRRAAPGAGRRPCGGRSRARVR